MEKNPLTISGHRFSRNHQGCLRVSTGIENGFLLIRRICYRVRFSSLHATPHRNERCHSNHHFTMRCLIFTQSAPYEPLIRFGFRTGQPVDEQFLAFWFVESNNYYTLETDTESQGLVKTEIQCGTFTKWISLRADE